jgi:hypothetical protein
MKNRPTTRGISERENENAFRRNWRWTTNTSASAYIPARTNQGIR